MKNFSTVFDAASDCFYVSEYNGTYTVILKLSNEKYAGRYEAAITAELYEKYKNEGDSVLTPTLDAMAANAEDAPTY
jgi:hypothetical protein